MSRKLGGVVDLYFNNSIFFIAFVVVAAVVFLSLIILARDLVMFIIRRLQKKASQPIQTDRSDSIREEDFE